MKYLLLSIFLLLLANLALGGAWLAVKPWDEADGAVGEQNGSSAGQEPGKGRL